MRAAGDRVLEALAIRPGERAAIGWLFLHSLFLGIFVAFFFSTANAQFLERFGPSALSWGYIVSGVVGFATIALFARLQRRLAPVTVLVSALGFLVLLTGGLWLAALVTDARWVAFAMFVWIFPALSLLNLEFWGLAGMLFDLRQGKRLYGLLGTGEVISALVGFLLVPLLLEFLSRPIELLPLAATGLLASMLIVRLMAPRFAAQLDSRPEPGAARAPGAAPAPLGDRYFVLIAALISLALVAGYFVDFGFLTQVRERFGDSAAIARFIAVFFALVKILELAMKGFLAGRLMSWFGLGFGLMMLPAALLLSAGGAALAGSLLGTSYAVFFLLVALTKLLWLVLRKSLFDPAFKVLYQPLPRERRLAFQTRVEGFVQQGGVIAVGLFLLAFTRWGPGGAHSLFYLLLPVLGLWLGAAVLVHREYRSRLIETLQGRSPPPDARAIEEPILEILAGAPAEAAGEVLRLLCRVRPTLVAGLWGPLLERASPEVRRAVLELVGQIRAGEAREVVAALASDPAEPLRELAAAALGKLDAVEELARSPERLDALAESAEVEERRLAAVAAACDPPRVQALNQLLWDRDPGVRRTALLAAGRTGDRSFVPRIVANLAIPAFSATAAAAAVAVGEPILGELEAAFKRAGDDLELRGRILAIYEEIGGPAAGAAIFDKLDFPHAWIQQRALAALGRFPLPDDPEHSGRVGRWIERAAEVAAWNLAALVDLAATPEAAEVRASLEREVHRTREFLFELLELLCDRRAIRLVRQHLERGGQDASVYALEIADLVIPPDLKPIVLPLFEPLTPAQCLRRLDGALSQPRMTPEERLRALAHRDHSRIG
ncbi:MAG TPA: HEAT repeat domain-containing protein, partial [Thermoanaerobaculia bacterium]|nr:HEAT repeat domain-containing protein [Thermoanaerobaculia bacterium]